MALFKKKNWGINAKRAGLAAQPRPASQGNRHDLNAI